MTFVDDRWILVAEGASMLIHATGVWTSCLQVAMCIGREKVLDDVDNWEVI